MHVVPDGHEIALENLRQAVEVLVTGSGPIRARLQGAEPYFGRAVEAGTFPSKAERHLCLRIGAGLELAGDILRLYELVAGLRDDDGYWLSRDAR